MEESCVLTLERSHDIHCPCAVPDGSRVSAPRLWVGVPDGSADVRVVGTNNSLWIVNTALCGRHVRKRVTWTNQIARRITLSRKMGQGLCYRDGYTTSLA